LYYVGGGRHVSSSEIGKRLSLVLARAHILPSVSERGRCWAMIF
jgi:hypothetical protein